MISNRYENNFDVLFLGLKTFNKFIQICKHVFLVIALSTEIINKKLSYACEYVEQQLLDAII